mgnify:CR=1 FL=1
MFSESEERMEISVMLASHSLGDYRKATECHKTYLKIAIEVGDWAGEREAYGNLCNAYQSLGDYRKSLESNEKQKLAQ